MKLLIDGSRSGILVQSCKYQAVAYLQYSASHLQPTRRNTILTSCSCLFFIILGIALLIQGMNRLKIYSIKALYELGFGTVSAQSVVGVSTPGLVATALFANLPQGILSFLYNNLQRPVFMRLGCQRMELFCTFAEASTGNGSHRQATFNLLPPTPLSLCHSKPCAILPIVKTG